MKSNLGRARVWIVIVMGIVAALACTFAVLGIRRYRNRPVALVGAVIKADDDARKQSPIEDVQVTTPDGQAAGVAQTNSAGYFKLKMKPGIRRDDPVTLQFRNPKYEPLDLQTAASDDLYIVHMTALPASQTASANQPEVTLTNVRVRYSTGTSGQVNVGTGLKTFQVENKGNVPCDSVPPCSPSGKWKAAIDSASLDANEGNVYEDARVFCIAGPCPFTKIEIDGYSHGGRKISVSVRNWSDTTTFLLEAEVFRQQQSDMVRESYPVIFGRTFDFSLPASAEGTTLEAELNRVSITFPLSPDLNLSWTSCVVTLAKNNSKIYRCELKPGYKFP